MIKAFDKYKEDYQDLCDFFAGERRVKQERERYTPRLESQSGKEKLYEQYVAFGILFNALQRTRQGLKGAILRKPVDIQFPENSKAILDSVMLDGASFDDFVREACDNVLGYGRYGALVDIDEKENTYIAVYEALSILDWPSIRNVGIDQEILLKEMVEIVDTENPGETKPIEQRRKLEIKGGYYLVTVYQKGPNDEGWIPVQSTPEVPNPREPTYKGFRLKFIPFVFFGSSSNVPAPSRPPLLDLLNILKGHWRLTVAYQYALNFTGLPTPCFAGFDFEKGQKTPLGPGASYHSDDPNAKSWFLQTGGQGLAEIERGLDRLESQMAVAGARLLEEQRPGVEAAETVRLRSSGDSATLSDIAGNIEAGATQVLKYIGFWVGIPETACQVTVNKDFVSTRLSAQDITALLQVVQAGKMSVDTFLYNLQQGETLQTGRTIEEEKEAIAEDRIVGQRNNPNLANLAGTLE